MTIRQAHSTRRAGRPDVGHHKANAVGRASARRCRPRRALAYGRDLRRRFLTAPWTANYLMRAPSDGLRGPTGLLISRPNPRCRSSGRQR